MWLVDRHWTDCGASLNRVRDSSIDFSSSLYEHGFLVSSHYKPDCRRHGRNVAIPRRAQQYVDKLARKIDEDLRRVSRRCPCLLLHRFACCGQEQAYFVLRMDECNPSQWLETRWILIPLWFSVSVVDDD